MKIINKRITKKQQTRSRVDRLLQIETFITWDMLGISPLNNYNHQTYDAKVVFDYMKELGIDYMRYSDKILIKKCMVILVDFIMTSQKEEKENYSKLLKTIKISQKLKVF